MKYVKQFGIILVVSLIGELLNFLIPLPIPASIYGLVLMAAIYFMPKGVWPSLVQLCRTKVQKKSTR